VGVTFEMGGTVVAQQHHQIRVECAGPLDHEVEPRLVNVRVAEVQVGQRRDRHGGAGRPASTRTVYSATCTGTDYPARRGAPPNESGRPHG